MARPGDKATTNGGDILAFVDDFDCLSNFYYSSVHLDGVSYPTVEHAFQAAKTFAPKDRARIRACSNPAQAKGVGRRVTLREDWETVKIGVMEILVREKFTVHEDLKARLLATGKRRLVEGNTWGDAVWGVCGGRGKNHLGRILMRVREELREAPPS